MRPFMKPLASPFINIVMSPSSRPTVAAGAFE